MHPSIKHFAPLFGFKHLPPHLQTVSRRFAELALRAAGGFDGTWDDLRRDLAENA